MSDTGVRSGPEWSFLLAACSPSSDGEKSRGLKQQARLPLCWQSLFTLAESHGVQPLLYQSLSAMEDVVPEDQRRALRHTFQGNLLKSMLLSRELIRIVDHLCGHGVDVMAYKGLALAEALYGDIAMRQAGDIDLLIRASDFRKCREALAQLDYAPHSALLDQQEQAILRTGYESVFDGTAGHNILEVQWAFQPRFYAVSFDMNGVFERSVPVNVAGRPMKTPSPADLLLTLSMHAAKHVWGRLIWLCDIARLQNLPSLDWPWIISEARRLGIFRILQLTMMMTNSLLKADIPAALPVLGSRSASQVVEDVQRRLATATPFDVASLSYFRLMMRLRERRSDRLRFLARLVLTPGPSEWQSVQLPQALFPFYPFVRISRLAGRMLGW